MWQVCYFQVFSQITFSLSICFASRLLVGLLLETLVANSEVMTLDLLNALFCTNVASDATFIGSIS